MGIIRKTMSVTTLGLVDYRSDRERTARSTRLTKRATKRGNHQAKRQSKALLNQVYQMQQQMAYNQWWSSLTPEQQRAYVNDMARN